MFYATLKVLFSVLFRIFLRLEGRGSANIPATGPLVIASNHLSMLDPPVIGPAGTRKMYFMAKEELFVPVFGSICKALGAFPVKRGGADRAALRHALDILRRNEVLAIFPEGTRSKDGTLGRAEPGALMMALKGGATVVPTCVAGTDLARCGRLWPKVRVSFGKPMLLPPAKAVNKEMLAELTQELMQRIAALQTGEEDAGQSS